MMPRPFGWPVLCNPVHSRIQAYLRNTKVQQPLHWAPTHPLPILLLRRAPNDPHHTSSVSIHTVDIRRSSWDNKHVTVVQDHIISFAGLQTDFLSQSQEQFVKSCSVGMGGQRSCRQAKRNLAKVTREGCVAVVNDLVFIISTRLATQNDCRNIPSASLPASPNKTSSPPRSGLGTT